MLGIINKEEMVKLRNACTVYGPGQPTMINRKSGPPIFHIPKSILNNFINDGFQIVDISKKLSVSERTIYRRLQQYDLRVESFSDINDEELLFEMRNLVKEFPF